MPWLVSLGGFKSTNYWKHICGGSIITKKHVLTLASCIEKLVNSKETFIQGPKLFFGTDDTFDHFTGVNRNIAATFQHPKYKDKAGFDVGVVAVDEDIIFTDNIRPVCLPNFPHETSFEGENLFLQQFTYSQEWESFMLRNDDVTENGCQENVEGLSCLRKGDFEVNEGSPVVKKVTQTARREGYHVQEFISKNQMEMVKISERFILSWIQNITDTAPVLMVYGGKAKDGTPNYSTEVDIVTGNPNICYKVNKAKAERWTWTMEDGTEQSSWAFEAKQYNVAKNEIKDSGKYFIQAIGMAGHFVNDAVILCGGYYGAFESEICFQYDFEFNK